MPNKPTFEESIEIIDKALRKHAYKWQLSAVPSISFEDISQIIRIHIHEKWDQYNPEKALAPWINQIISRQIINQIRNHYGHLSRPCLRCPQAEGQDLCKLFQTQCNSACELYAAWEKGKRYAYNVKLPLSVENHENEVKSMTSDSFNLEESLERLHEKMKVVLNEEEFMVYKFLFVDKEEESKLVALLSTDKNSKILAQKRIQELKIIIQKKVETFVKTGDYDL